MSVGDVLMKLDVATGAEANDSIGVSSTMNLDLLPSF